MYRLGSAKLETAVPKHRLLGTWVCNVLPLPACSCVFRVSVIGRSAYLWLCRFYGIYLMNLSIRLVIYLSIHLSIGHCLPMKDPSKHLSVLLYVYVSINQPPYLPPAYLSTCICFCTNAHEGFFHLAFQKRRHLRTSDVSGASRAGPAFHAQAAEKRGLTAKTHMAQKPHGQNNTISQLPTLPT